MTDSSTKYILLVGDGMADYPLPELNGKTPLETASTPNMDRIAACRIGGEKTIPEGMEPGRDDHDGWQPTTKKKGPGRRLTRRQRKNNAKISKL